MSQQIPGPYGTPPNQPQLGYLTPPPTSPRPTSVTVLAVIGIIFGGLGSLCSPFALFPYMIKMPGPPNPAIDVVKDTPAMMAWVVGGTLIQWVLSVALLVGAIAALSLKPWARTLMLAYSWASLVMGAIGIIVNVIWLLPMMAKLPPSAAATGAYYGAVGGAVGAALALAFPACVVYFFTRQHVIAAFDSGGQVLQ